MWNDYEQQDLFRKKVEGSYVFNATYTFSSNISVPYEQS